MSDFYAGWDEAESIATLNLALDRGITLLDTADMCSAGANQKLVGRVVRECRDWVVVATKLGTVRGQDGGWRDVCGRPDHVRQACDVSLRPTGLDVGNLNISTGPTPRCRRTAPRF